MQHQNRSPQNIRIENRKAKNRKIWAGPEWKAKKEEGLKKHPQCESVNLSTGVRCESPSQVPHHPDVEVYGKPEYLNLDDTRWFCNCCHQGTHKGKFPCPVCGKVRSKLADTPCYRCTSPSDKQRIKDRKDDRIQRRNEIARKKSRKYRPVKVINKQTGKWVTISRK